jgi:hypothetical protein
LSINAIGHVGFDHPKPKGKWLICCDPNGVRLELVEYPEGEKILERQPQKGDSL